MNTKLILLSIFLLSLFGRGMANSAHQNADFPENLSELSQQQLLDTALYYYYENRYDTALLLYKHIIETPVNENDMEQKKIITDAYINCGVIHYYMNEYKTAYDFFIKALELGEETDYNYKPFIYLNMGVVYSTFKQHDFAKSCYLKTLDFCEDDTARMIVALNNLGQGELAMEKTDSALFFLNKALQLSEQFNHFNFDATTNGMATFYKNAKQYDSAYHYYLLSLNETRKQNNLMGEICNLSDLGALFFEMNNFDSALYYIHLSNDLATDNYFQNIAVKNYLLLSQIELAKGNIEKSLEYHLRSTNLNDSLFNASKLGDINRLQHDYDFAKINEQLEELKQELQTKKRTINYQLTFWIITIVVLLLVIGASLFFYRKNKKKSANKQSKCSLSEEAQKELLNDIQTFMKNNISVICDSDFSIKDLSKSINSNQGYVSSVINKHLKKNFRIFLNEYRIEEAKRLFSGPDAHLYTIESIARKSGFKSRDSFNKVFKEITGVTPAEFLKGGGD